MKLALTQDVYDSILADMQNDKKIQAIKKFREATYMSLMNSKRAVELIAEGTPIKAEMQYTVNGIDWLPLPYALEVDNYTRIQFRFHLSADMPSAFTWEY
jgi:hypothetical protein